MKSDLRQVIYEHTLTASSLTSSNTFWAKAMQGLTGEFCVISLVTNPINRDTEKEYDEYFLQFSIVGETLTTLETMENDLRSAWDDIATFKTSLDTAGYKLAGLYIQNREHLIINNDIHQLVSRYKVEIYV